MGQEVLDIENTADVVCIVLIDRNTAVVVLYDALQHILIVGVNVERYDILAACHHLLGSLVAEAYDAFQHALLVLYILLIGKFESLLQIVNAQHVTLFLHNLLCQNAAAQQNVLHKPEQFAADHDAADKLAAEAQRVLTAVHLRHNLAEEQQQKGEQHRERQKLQPVSLLAEVYKVREYVVAEHDYRHVHKVVCDENRSESALAVLTQCLYVAVACSLRFVHLRHIGRRETKERNLRSAGECREAHEHYGQYCRYYYAYCRSDEINVG